MHGTQRMNVLGLAAIVLAAGCARVKIPEPTPPAPAKDYTRQLPPGTPALRKITDPGRMPDFRRAFAADRESLVAALDQSIRYLHAPSSRKHYPVQDITHDRAEASLPRFRELIISAQSGDELQQRLIAAFDVYESVGCDDEGTVLFTCYYTPIFNASLTPTDEYRWPLYKLPPDLVKGEEGDCLGRRLPEGGLAPYYSRAEIEGGALKGQELVWLKDRFEAYICTVQGSARLKLLDGQWFNVGYHGNNGKAYTSVGTLLTDAGLIPKDKLTLTALIAFFRDHPEGMEQYLPRNERTVFFEQTNAEPTGSLGVPVTAYRSIATDKNIFPRGCVALVQTAVPQPGAGGVLSPAPFSQFVLDQDTGGSIRAPGRCDISVGVGDEAGRVAGGTLNEGRLYYLFVKEGPEPSR